MSVLEPPEDEVPVRLGLDEARVVLDVLDQPVDVPTQT